jgi:hypothetical protein
VGTRSFLNAGTNVLPGERKFLDYAFPPTHVALDVVSNTRGRVGWHNSPPAISANEKTRCAEVPQNGLKRGVDGPGRPVRGTLGVALPARTLARVSSLALAGTA